MFDRFQPPADPLTVAHCAWCGREIYAGTEVKRLVDHREGFVHAEECANEYAFDLAYDAEGTINEAGDVD